MSDAPDYRSAQEALVHLGWPIKVDGDFGRISKAALFDFQRGFAWYDIAVDGDLGPESERALSVATLREGHTSDHFVFAEFKSKGDGWIKVHRELVRGLEQYRSLVGGPVEIISGYRDPAYNHSVGGAPNSQHMFGNAVDLAPFEPYQAVFALRRFGGIGKESNGLVRHVDVRHVDPPVNYTHSTVDRPAVWVYGS